MTEGPKREKCPFLGEAEEAIPLDEAAMADEQSILKKDAEHVGNVNLGLDNTEHKIVKGRNALSRVVGNRVYLKVNKVKDEKQLAPLVEYLENTIALPNNLIFDDFQFDNGQLSMRISRFNGQKPKSAKRIDSVEGVAQAVYKRRKDIARFSGAEVAETGIGSGEDTVPVESTDRDWLFRPVLVICGFTIMALLTVLGVSFFVVMTMGGVLLSSTEVVLTGIIVISLGNYSQNKPIAGSLLSQPKTLPHEPRRDGRGYRGRQELPRLPGAVPTAGGRDQSPQQEQLDQQLVRG